MKISNTTPPNYIHQVYAGQISNGAAQNLKAQKPVDEKTDSINLSDQTKILQKIDKAMETEPADRKKYVAGIKQDVDNGRYDINAEAVAEKIVGSLMNEVG